MQVHLKNKDCHAPTICRAREPEFPKMLWRLLGKLLGNSECGGESRGTAGRLPFFSGADTPSSPGSSLRSNLGNSGSGAL